MSQIKPLNDRVLIKREKPEETSAGGVIIIPPTAQEKTFQGTVVAVGPGTLGANGQRIPLQVKEGDLVLFGKYDGTEIKKMGEDHLIMPEGKILAIVQRN
jgi:chaperonin GroES